MLSKLDSKEKFPRISVTKNNSSKKGGNQYVQSGILRRAFHDEFCCVGNNSDGQLSCCLLVIQEKKVSFKANAIHTIYNFDFIVSRYQSIK